MDHAVRSRDGFFVLTQGGISFALLALAIGCHRPAPPGVDCSDHVSCSNPEGACPDCLVVPGCGPICIPTNEACELSCPTPNECTTLESFPPQLECGGAVPGFGEPALPSTFGCGEASCSVAQQYCEVVLAADRAPFEDPDVGITRACRPLPAPCLAELSCECLHEETGLDTTEAACNRTSQGGLTLSRRTATPCSDAGQVPCTRPAITPRR